jgi:crotonobetainyl-CoA:carnitine CoA-transferase CaiB-like acyl-CoA transferase
MADGTAKGPLAGVKVLEITTMIAGPLAGAMLADLGAAVTKIEGTSGDPFRWVPPMRNGLSAHYLAVNRHKRSIALDLKSEGGRAIAQTLANEADVMIVNTRPAAMQRLGLDYETLKQTNPGLIYVMISGFGPDGPYADRPAYDQVIQGLSGGMYIQSDGALPAKPLRSMFVDKYSASAAASAVSTALYAREKNGGVGQFISVPLLKAFSFLNLVDNVYNYTYVNSEDKLIAPNVTRPFRTADGVFMGYFQTDELFAAVCRAFGMEHLLDDERFNAPMKRVANWDAMWVELEKGSIKMTSDELEALAISEGLPVAKMKSVEEFMEDPQVQHLGCVEHYESERYGPITQIAHPVDFKGTPALGGGVAAQLGEHTDEVLRELGYDEERIGKLRADKAVR